MDQATIEIFRRHSKPLQPRETGQQPLLRPLPLLKAVLFDIYGTLLISASGEIGASKLDVCASAFAEVLSEAGIQHRVDGTEGVERLIAGVEIRHAALREKGIEFPEVDILQVWQDVLNSLAADGLLQDSQLEPSRLRKLAVEYEVRTNPIWPMPGFPDCLRPLRDAGMVLGIISNAQSFTRELFPALLDSTLEGLGFHPALQLLSYAYEQAKPGQFLFQRAREIADTLFGIQADEVLYVGNDMLNDVYAASQVGFRTALFAGDDRSLRLRAGDNRVDGLAADLILTDLNQLPRCLPTGQ